MEMHQIRYFLAVAETLNFTRAAEECNVAQPSLSRAIGKLEEELGGDLFRRERGQTHLTDLGRSMLPFLRQSYESALAAKDLAGGFQNAEFAPLRIGLSLTVSLAVIGPVLAELSKALPGLELHFERGPAEDVLAALKAGDVELVVVAEAALDWDRFVHWPLFEEGFVIIAAREHTLRDRNELSLPEIAGETLIARPSCESMPAFKEALGRHEITVRQTHEAADDADIAALVENGLGLSIVPASTGRAMGASALPVSDFTFTRTVQACGVAGRQHSVAASGLVRLLRAADWPGAAI